MDTKQLLDELSEKIDSGEISAKEVLSLPGMKRGKKADGEASPFQVTKMLYVLGAAIVVIGISIFVYQIWNDIASVGRISVTLGLGLVLTACGSALLKHKPDDEIGSVFLCMGGVLIPGGAMVTLSELGAETASMWPVAITFGIICAFYALLNLVHRNSILVFFAIGNGTAFLYLLTEAMLDDALRYTGYHGDVYAYLTMAVGLGYLLLAEAFRHGRYRKILGLLHFFGISAFLGAAFSRVFDSVPWQMLYFPIIVGCFAVAVRLRSRSILVMSTIFLIAHVSYITGEYFADSIGWPICLVLLGFAFIALGYASITINRKYMAADGAKS